LHITQEFITDQKPVKHYQKKRSMKALFCSNCLERFEQISNLNEKYCSIRCSIEYHTGMKFKPEETDWSKVTVAEAKAQQEFSFK
jgi:hypothetical protein